MPKNIRDYTAYFEQMAGIAKTKKSLTKLLLQERAREKKREDKKRAVNRGAKNPWQEIFKVYTTVCMQNRSLTPKELEAVREIRNSLMHRGKIPSIRELMNSLDYRSPRSASVIIDKLLKKRVLRRKTDGGLQFLGNNLENDTMRAQTVDVPLVGTAACGAPILAEENVQAKIPVSTKLAKPPHKYFLLKAKGDSMDQKGINDGDMVLVRQQPTAQNGDTVVALIDEEATIKEFQATGKVVVLKPRSKNKDYKPIVLTNDFKVQGIVVTTLGKIWQEEQGMSKKENINPVVSSALKEAQWLISEEYQSVADEELKKKYEEVLKKIENAIEQITR